MCPNLGALFAEHLVKLKMKPFQAKGAKKETFGSLLTPIFMHCGVPLDDSADDKKLVYMDAAHLTSAYWLKDNHYWSFRDEDGTHLVELPPSCTHGLLRRPRQHLVSPQPAPPLYSIDHAATLHCAASWRTSARAARGSASAIPAHARHVYTP